MVYPGEIEKEKEESVLEYMPTETDRSKTLHNFNFPSLKWGNQRFLRCRKMDSPAAAEGKGDGRLRRRSSLSGSGGSSFSTITSGHENVERRRRSWSAVAALWQSSGDVEEGIDEVREKLMMDLTKVVDRMKKSILRQEEISVDEDDDAGEEKENDQKNDEQMENRKKKRVKKMEELPSPSAETAAASEEALPWNLRTRRGASAAASKAPAIGDAYEGGFDGFTTRTLKTEERRANHSPATNDGVRSAAVKTERPKFSVALRKKEIEKDFMALMGRRPPRRPKKRPRHVQKHMDTLFPGLWLGEITSRLYKVSESAENGKVE